MVAQGRIRPVADFPSLGSVLGQCWLNEWKGTSGQENQGGLANTGLKKQVVFIQNATHPNMSINLSIS